MLLGVDLAPRKCGWCAGDGSTIPLAGGFRLSADISDLDGVLEETRGFLTVILERFRPAAVMIESPILPGSHGSGPVMGSLAQRRAQFGQNAFVRWLVRYGNGIPCAEVDLWQIKDALTGNKRAEKGDMVLAAERLGIVLPEALANGREDAADAVGAWLVLLRQHDKNLSQQWDRRIHSPRGAKL